MFVTTKKMLDSLNLKLVLALGATTGLVYYIYTRRNKCDSEFDDNQNLEKKESDNVIALQFKAQGNKYFANEDYVKAIDCYTNAIRNCDKSRHEDLANFYYNRAFACEKLKNFEGALEDVSIALRMNKLYKKAYLKRGKLHEYYGDYEAALTDYSALNFIGKFESEHDRKIMDGALEKLIDSKIKNMDLDNKMVIPGKHALKLIIDSFMNDPIFSRNLLTSELVNEESELLEKAKKHFLNRDVIEALEIIEPFAVQNNFLAILFRGTINVLVGLSSKALKDFELILDNSDNISDKSIVVNASLKLANWFLRNQDFEQCEKMLQKALDADENDPDVYSQKGQYLLLLERYEDSLHQFNKSLKLMECVQNQANLYYVEFRLASIQNDETAKNELHAKFKALINKYPAEMLPCFVYGQILMQLNKVDESEECYQKTLDLEPDNAVAWFNRALLQLQTNYNIEVGLESLRRAVELDPTLVEAIDMLARIELSRKNFETSVELFAKSIKVTVNKLEMIERIKHYYITKAQLQIYTLYNFL